MKTNEFTHSLYLPYYEMRIFRKRQKFGNFGGPPRDAEPLPDIVHQMGAEAARQYVALQAKMSNPHDANANGHGMVYTIPHVSMSNPQPAEDHFYEDMLYAEEDRNSSPLNFLSSVFGSSRSKSRERRANRQIDRFVRSGSPEQFHEYPPGTPVKYRRRPASPELMQQRVGSPYHFVQQERVPSPLHFVPQERVPSPLHFAQNPRPSSPDIARRLQRAQHSQELQRLERQQRRQQDMMIGNPIQLIPQYPHMQQPYYPTVNPNAHIQTYPILQAPPMYSYY